jgi:hypothetical protein
MSKTLPKGHRSCLTEEFRYIPAASTDIARTFERIRRQLARETVPLPGNVRVLTQRKPTTQPAQ